MQTTERPRSTEPRLGEPGARIEREERVVDEYGNEEVVAVDERGRRWYTLRPTDPGRYDYLGFGLAWWVLLWAVLIGFIAWGWAGWWW